MSTHAPKSYRMLFNPDLIHKVLGSYVLRAHGFDGVIPASISAITIMGPDNRVEQVRIEVTPAEGYGNDAEDHSGYDGEED